MFRTNVEIVIAVLQQWVLNRRVEWHRPIFSLTRYRMYCVLGVKKPQLSFCIIKNYVQYWAGPFHDSFSVLTRYKIVLQWSRRQSAEVVRHDVKHVRSFLRLAKFYAHINWHDKRINNKYCCNPSDNLQVVDHGELEQSVPKRLRQRRKTGNTILWLPKQEKLISFAARAFCAAAPTVWNSLGVHTRSADRFLTFKNRLKTELFKSCYP